MPTNLFSRKVFVSVLFTLYSIIALREQPGGRHIFVKKKFSSIRIFFSSYQISLRIDIANFNFRL